MTGVIVKPWGYEYCAFDNGKAAIWILHIARGRKTSRHCHPKKRTRLIPLQGEVIVNGGPMMHLGVADIDKGVFHQTVALGVETASENGAFLMEIEEPSDKGDIVREDDAYGRAAQPIEQTTIPCKVPLLEISHKESSAMGYRFKLESTMGGAAPDLLLDVGGEVMGIYREKTRRLSDCVADFVKSLGIKHVFGVTGGGSMHLNDAFRDFFVANHHEQASAMAAEAYGRLGGIGCALVTTGPGGTNAVTGVACAWVDSIPVVFLSGQVTRSTLIGDSGLRQLGVQETDIVSLVKSITKYAVTVTDERNIRLELEKAAHIARSGRPGPVWVDIPLDIQSKAIDWDALPSFKPKEGAARKTFDAILPDLNEAKRPVFVIGNGVRLAGAGDSFRALAEHWYMPVLSSWAAADIVPSDYPNYIGRFGIFGDRASNFTVQNADLLIVLGSRLSIPQTGYNLKTFARGAKIVWVDVDENEMRKLPNVQHACVANVADFIEWALLRNPRTWPNWSMRCRQWKHDYPVVAFEKREEENNSFHFIERLSEELPEDAVVVTDMGTAFTCTFQSAKMKAGQRWITASGHAPMGYALPGAIGAHYATGKRITCIVGDGSLMMNLQELQTIGERKLPIDIYVLSNGGYLTMKHTQANHFGHFVGSEFKFPRLHHLSDAFGVALHEIVMDPMQPLIPRSSSTKLPDGTITSRPIEDLYPFLPREELKANMIVPTAEVFQ